MTGESPLAGLRIVVTRPEDQAAELLNEIRRRGGEPLIFPVIRIVDPESWEPCDAVLRKIDHYDLSAVTSANAVRKIFARANALGTNLANVPWYAVGEATGRALEKERITPAGVSEEATAESLARLLGKTGLRGKRVLLPQGNLARPVLKEFLDTSGAIAEEVIVYRTLEASPDSSAALKATLQRGEIDVVTFASPSAVSGFLRLTGGRETLLREDGPRIAVIGPTTAKAVIAEGLTADIVAMEASSPALVEAIEQYYRH